MEGETNQIQDQELVKKSLENPQAYAQLVERYEKPLFRYVMRLGCPTSEDAHDILQDTFIKAFVNLNDYDHEFKFSSWIYRIAHNETISFFRKAKIRPVIAETEEQLRFIEQISDGKNLVAESDNKLFVSYIREAVSGLNKKHRDVLILRFLENKSYEEISDILQIPIGTVATMINRGKLKIKGVLSHFNLLETT